VQRLPKSCKISLHLRKLLLFGAASALAAPADARYFEGLRIGRSGRHNPLPVRKHNWVCGGKQGPKKLEARVLAIKGRQQVSSA